MKILIVSQYYWPENYRANDIAESLAALGNSVTVLTGLPNYPSGRIFPDYKNGCNRTQIHNGVKIIRAKLFPRKKNAFSRFLNYWSFQHYGKKLVDRIDEIYDIVLVYSGSPVMLAYPGIKYAKKYNKRLIMYEMDLWPESLLAGGLTKKSCIFKHYKKVSANIYSCFDKIFVSTRQHIQYIKNLPNCKDVDIEYLPQYADSIFEETKFENNNDEIIDIMFAGNIGKAQSVDTIIKAASLLKDDKRFIFHIVGSGSEMENISKLCHKLRTHNVVFYGQRPLIDMPKLYKKADVMLVTLEDKPYANMTIPGKVQSYMACGKPMIGCINGSTANFIIENKIGYVCKAQDFEGLAFLIKNLKLTDLKKMGNKSREIYNNSLSKKMFFKKLLRELQK